MKKKNPPRNTADRNETKNQIVVFHLFPVNKQGPVFTMAKSFTAYLVDSINYKEHVTVTSNNGPCEIDNQI